MEKGSAYARSGQLLPPYDTRCHAARAWPRRSRASAPARIIALGDSFHDRDAAERLDAPSARRLLAWRAAANWIWIAGNHDPEPPAWLGGEIAEELAIGGLISAMNRSPVRSRARSRDICIPAPGSRNGAAGPAALLRVGRRRLVLPSFGAYAGGLDVGDKAIASLFAGPFHAFMLGSERVYAIPQHFACVDKSRCNFKQEPCSHGPRMRATQVSITNGATYPQ